MVKKEKLSFFWDIIFRLLIIVFFVFGVVFFRYIIVRAFSWSTPLVLDGIVTDPGISMTIQAESASLVHAAYCNNSLDSVRYITINNGVTSTPEAVEDQNTSCISTSNISLALSGSTPVIAFHGATNGLFYAIRDGAGVGNADDNNWNYYTVTSTGVMTNDVSLAINGSTYGISFQGGSSDLYYATCSSVCSATTSWSFEKVDDVGTVVTGKYSDLTFDTANGWPVIAYVDATNSELRYAIRNGAGAGNCTDNDWNCYVVDSAYGSTPSPSIAIDSNGKIGIAYQLLARNGIRYAFQDAGSTGCAVGGETTFTCSSVTTTDTGDYSYYTDLTYKGTVPLISWYYEDNSTAEALMLSYYFGGIWTTEQIATATNYGKFTSISSFGNTTYIGYYDGGTPLEAMLTSATISFNTAPSATAITPSQTTSNIVTLTTTVADVDSDVTSLVLEYSLDNSTWASSTIADIIVFEGAVTTSTGSISGIDTNLDGSVDLTIEWNALADIPNTDDTTVYFRVIPNDGTENGSTQTSGAFTVDTKSPTAPGALTMNATSTISADINFGSATVDNGFVEYKIFYKAGASGVTEGDTAITSSTDADLGSISYGGVATTSISGLSVNTQYVANIWAYDSWARSAYAASELSFYTLANAPGTPTVAVSSTTALNLIINQNSNPSNTTYAICKTTNGTSCVAGGYVQADGSLNTSAVWQTFTVWGGATGIDITGLSVNTSYQFLVQAKNGDDVTTLLSSANTGKYTLASTPNAPATVTSTSATTLNITLGADNGATSYSVYDSVADKYLQADGTWGASAAWLSYSALGNGSTTSTTGLTANTPHTIQVKGKNGDGTETSYSTGLSLYTLANVPSAPTVNNPSTTTLDITINVNSNPASTQFAIQEVVSNDYVQADGSFGASAVWQTNAVWGTVTVSGLSINNAYQFKVKARNGDNTPTALSSANTAVYTLAEAPATSTIGSVSTNSVILTFGNESNPVTTEYAVYESVTGLYLAADDVLDSATAVWQTTSTWNNPTITGLSPNVQYIFQLIARNGENTNTATTSASAVYTLAETGTAPTVSTPTVSSLAITVNAGNNSANTTYAIYNFTSSVYPDSLGASTSTAVYQTASAWSGITATDLIANTAYQFKVIPRNGNSTNATTSTASTAVYTSANIPSASAVANSTTQITVSWTGDATQYYAENTTAVTNSDWFSASSYAFSGLTCGTSYSFRVKGRNGDSVDTSYASSVSVSTSDCPVSSGSSGGGIIIVSPPTLPSVSLPVIVPIVSNIQGVIGNHISFSVGDSSHELIVLSADVNQARVIIKSDPITVILKKDEIKDLDTNTDTINDLRIIYIGLIGGKPRFSFVNLTDPNEIKKPVTINYGAYDAYSTKVILSFNVPDATQMAVSNYSDFRNTSFIPYTSKMAWVLTSGEGEKSVFVRFRTSQGGIADASDTIYFSSKTVTPVKQSVVTPSQTTTPIIPVVPQTLTTIFNFTKELRLGSIGTEVKSLQRFLKDQGYFTYQYITTYFGNITKTALLGYQKFKQLNTTGILDKPTRDVINRSFSVQENISPDATIPTSSKYIFKNFLTRGNVGAEVKELQIRLQELGFMPTTITANGVFGPATQAAVIKLQKTHNLKPPAGYVGPGTRGVLNGD